MANNNHSKTPKIKFTKVPTDRGQSIAYEVWSDVGVIGEIKFAPIQRRYLCYPDQRPHGWSIKDLRRAAIFIAQLEKKKKKEPARER